MTGQANLFTIPRAFVDIVGGDWHAAVLLSQCIYWSDRGAFGDDTFYKSDRAFRQELGFTDYRLRKARKLLIEARLFLM